MSPLPRPRAAGRVRSPGHLPRWVARLRVPRGRSGARGQALLELALVAPVLLLLVLAALDLGRLFYSQITVTDSARDGAMEAAQNPTSYSTRCGLRRDIQPGDVRRHERVARARS